jgi:mannose-6-phosphate isomerase-like protein (cupin superfamily)
MEGSAEVSEGDGWAVAPHARAFGEGYGVRKVRQGIGVTEFGVNLITIPPGYETGTHAHESQQEMYFVHRGAIEMRFGDGGRAEIQAGGAARVDPSTVRGIRNLSDTEDAQYLVVGAAGGYVGRDGVVPEGETAPRGPGYPEGPTQSG